MDKEPCPSYSDSAQVEESTNAISSQSCSTGKKPRRQKSDRKKSNLRGKKAAPAQYDLDSHRLVVEVQEP